MGKPPFLEWGRLMGMTAGVYVFWAGIWGLFFRKFFWDFVGGVLGPAGLIPPASSKFFITTIVDIPLWQIFNILNGLLTLCMLYPLPIYPFQTKDVTQPPTLIERNLPLRIAFFFWCAWCAALVYQTVDASLFYLVAMGMHIKGMMDGDKLVKPTGGRGGSGLGVELGMGSISRGKA